MRVHTKLTLNNYRNKATLKTHKDFVLFCFLHKEMEQGWCPSLPQGMRRMQRTNLASFGIWDNHWILLTWTCPYIFLEHTVVVEIIIWGRQSNLSEFISLYSHNKATVLPHWSGLKSHAEVTILMQVDIRLLKLKRLSKVSPWKWNSL